MKVLLLLTLWAWAAKAPKAREPIIDATFYDAVIIGGGVAEVTAAMRLAGRGLRVILIDEGLKLGRCEAGKICRESEPALPDPGTEVLERHYGEPEELGALLARGEVVKVRLRADPVSVTHGEHLVSVRYRYQGLPRLVRARYAVLAWPGCAPLIDASRSLSRVVYASAVPGRAVRRGHCAAAEVLQRLRGSWKPEDWPPCGAP